MKTAEEKAREWLLEQLKEFPNHEEYDESTINAIANFMSCYHEYANQQNNQWVSVEERLPNVMGDYPVFVLLSDGTSDKAIWYSDGKFKGFYDGNYRFCFGESITHWMPTPQPPKH